MQFLGKILMKQCDCINGKVYDCNIDEDNLVTCTTCYGTGYRPLPVGEELIKLNEYCAAKEEYND